MAQKINIGHNTNLSVSRVIQFLPRGVASRVKKNLDPPLFGPIEIKVFLTPNQDLRQPFKGPRPRRGSCWEEQKRIISPVESPKEADQ